MGIMVGTYRISADPEKKGCLVGKKSELPKFITFQVQKTESN